MAVDGRVELRGRYCKGARGQGGGQQGAWTSGEKAAEGRRRGISLGRIVVAQTDGADGP